MMRNVKYVVLAAIAVVPLLAMAAGTPQTTQPAATDPEMQKLADQYTAAWAKGDSAAIAALYTTEGMYIDSMGKLMMGRSEIETGFKERFGSAFKGSTIVIGLGQTRQIGTDVRTAEGTWKISGLTPATTGAATASSPAGAAPTSGRYLNTLVRQQGKWMIAGTAAVPEITAPSPTR